MKLSDDDYVKKDFPVVQTVLGALGGALLIILVVLLTNSEKQSVKRMNQTRTQKKAEAQMAVEEPELELEPEIAYSQKKTAQDLNFWDMYPEGEETAKQKALEKKQEIQQEILKKEASDLKNPTDTEKEEEDPSTDGRHVQVVMDDGSTEWLTINRSLPMNSYEDTNFQKEGNILRYYRDGRSVSCAGVTLDKYSGKVDFDDLKRAGVSFVMVRVGGRGYDTGVITEDEQFEKYMMAATEAGMNIGVYFSSQALTAQEAAEEVDFVLQKVAPYKVSFPLAVKMETIRNDTSRTETLSKSDRTTVLRIFMEGLAGSAYKPMLMGDKNFLITKVDLAALSGYGIWLDKDGNIPEYPYQFSMWQYTDRGQIDGVENNVGLLMSFIDYSAR